MIEENEQAVELFLENIVMIPYVDVTGAFLGSWNGEPPEGAIAVNPAPEYADQMWLFPGWGPSPSRLISVENQWREAQLAIIANQLLAIEEAEAAAEEGVDPPADLLPGTRNQWLAYRTKVRAWKEGNVNFPDSAKRPVQPA